MHQDRDQGASYQRVEVITGERRRREWSDAEHHRALQPSPLPREPGEPDPADVYFGRATDILAERARIKRQTIEHRRLQHRKIAA
jgi:hypothetical protein